MGGQGDPNLGARERAAKGSDGSWSSAYVIITMTRNFLSRLVKATKSSFISSVDPNRRQGSWKFSVHLAPAGKGPALITLHPENSYWEKKKTVAHKGQHIVGTHRYGEEWLLVLFC